MRCGLLGLGALLAAAGALGVTFGAGHCLYVGARRSVEWDEDEDHIQITFDAEPVDIDAIKKGHWVSKVLHGLYVTCMDTVMMELDGVFSISADAVPITDKDNLSTSRARRRATAWCCGAPGYGLSVPQPH
ncbi:uncharacterized protein C2845_PM12G25070 [Panicum miliaceum]|uniref:Uncharacterized protein n=1 Tax=Panicum miliaceum TaxID=4540 RepID=A0A3L6QFF6_PANMI|nr:uncharacterized protein C2845_PM12G25070 [Panicum miliaceum]